MGYLVEIKESAVADNRAVDAFVDANGRTITFPSEEAADRTVRAFSSNGSTPVRLQRAAANDGSGVDAYVVVAPDRRIRTPSGSLEDGLTFDVGANLYGILGESLVEGSLTNPPLLTHYVSRTYDLDAAQFDVEVDPRPAPVESGVGDSFRWKPDCVATVYRSNSRTPFAELFCEVKTGNSSLERSQERAMRQRSRDSKVLVIRLDITALPESYHARIEEVAPDSAGTGVRDERTTLDDFS